MTDLSNSLEIPEGGGHLVHHDPEGLHTLGVNRVGWGEVHVDTIHLDHEDVVVELDNHEGRWVGLERVRDG